jgi:asparagine synthase (glutamine-hydrolysing)
LAHPRAARHKFQILGFGQAATEAILPPVNALFRLFQERKAAEPPLIMSGICGVLQLDGTSVAQRDLDLQMARLAHLGPDRARTCTAGPIGFGHLMMHITREDTYDTQPLRDSELSLVADLRLDNREALAEILSISTGALSGMSDSALLLAAYKKWGANCADHLIGDFAFAVWDAQKKSLTLSRDHMGQRHVFYHKSKGFFAFATEIKGLWALKQVPRNLSEAVFAQALLLDEPRDIGATVYENIIAVPGGSVLTVSGDGTMNLRRYWEPHADPAHENRDEAFYVETYRKVLSEAVACRLRRATTAAGLLMGGGFDSSAICALAGPVLAPQGRKLIAVSSVMPENYRGTIHHARRWVEICRRYMPHLDVRYVTREGLDIFTGMERAFLATDGGHSPNRYVNDAIYAEIAASGARIAMDGCGGDYTLNPRRQDALVRILLKGQFRRFVSEFMALRRHLRQSVKQTLVRNVILRLMPSSWMGLWKRHRSGLVLFGPTMPLSRRLIKKWSITARSRTARHSSQSQRVSMERVLRSQQNSATLAGSMAAASHGLEFTQPFHDKRVVELALAIPEELHFKNGRTRYLARAALRDLYPPEYQDRPPGNDDLGPDFLMMAKRIEPHVLAKIDRMEKAGYLSRYFDFARMRSMLMRRTVGQHASGNEFDTRQAMLAFLAARYIQWFRGDNR